MFKTQVVDSRNIRKTVAYKVGRIVLIPILLFLIALSFHFFGKDSAIERFFRENQSSIMQPFAIGIIILGLGLSIMMKMRLKNPMILGNLEMDEKGYRFIYNEKVEYSGYWNDTRFVSFEFYSSANSKNPRGCMNYLTILDKNGVKTFEFLIESSLVKADLGEFLRQLKTKIPIKITYAIPMKRVFHDNDFKF
jgi:hypothetical protein